MFMGLYVPHENLYSQFLCLRICTFANVLFSFLEVICAVTATL